MDKCDSCSSQTQYVGLDKVFPETNLGAQTPDQWLVHTKTEEFARFLKRACNCGNGFEKQWCEYIWWFPNSIRSHRKIFWEKNIGCVGHQIMGY